MIPVKYNVRNFRVRWATTLMTVMATGLVVFASVLTFSLADSVTRALRVTGNPLDLIVLRKGAADETSSGVEQRLAREVATLPGIARTADGEPMCSVEFLTILTKPRRNNGGTTNLMVRGLEQPGRALRPSFRIVEGRDLKPGLNEAIASPQMAERFENLRIGEKLEINGVDFQVVGYFAANGSAAESEVWTDLRDVTTARRTPGAVSSVNLRAADDASKRTLMDRIEKDEQFNLKVVDELEYYENQASMSNVLWWVAIFIALLLGIAAMLAAATTMYAAVAGRAREIGTLRALGFSRVSILISFILESVLLCLMGGVLGCLATLPLNGLTTGTANWATFSEITFAFQFGPLVLGLGLLMSLVMGVLGGLFPALRAVSLDIVSALRAQ